MLGALLLVAPQLLGEAQVFLVVAPARPRAGDRMRLDAPALDADQHLGRRADDREPAHPDEIHVGRRVDVAQRAIDGERVGLDVGLEALRQDGLVDVARGDALLDRTDAGLEDLFVWFERTSGAGCSPDSVCDSPRSNSPSRNSILAHAN